MAAVPPEVATATATVTAAVVKLKAAEATETAAVAAKAKVVATERAPAELLILELVDFQVLAFVAFALEGAAMVSFVRQRQPTRRKRQLFCAFALLQ